MTNFIVEEISKFAAFSFITLTVIYFSQQRYERIGNQFDLNEDTQNIYKNNFSKLNVQSKLRICPLYPKELSKY